MSTIPVCISDKDCELKWSAARRWVLSNAGYKIQSITSDYIETHLIRQKHLPYLVLGLLKNLKVTGPIVLLRSFGAAIG
ncbi:hypothetical protein [Pseudomonas veronii]|uniref:Uncharacterized protein n=1 Tax=Pseudomonas veronii TaxID=76761 RepID=A0A4P7Y0L9_PSEVE|nr:hypothetical protein [Pseudomonas veronii]QCG64265.1 hypothetical protein E4167_00100 [Pseudomonas veronii]